MEGGNLINFNENLFLINFVEIQLRVSFYCFDNNDRLSASFFIHQWLIDV